MEGMNRIEARQRGKVVKLAISWENSSVTKYDVAKFKIINNATYFLWHHVGMAYNMIQSSHE